MKTFNFEGYEINPLTVNYVTPVFQDENNDPYFIISPIEEKMDYGSGYRANEKRNVFIKLWNEALGDYK